MMMDTIKPYGPKRGEIWRKDNGKEVLVLKSHGSFCTVLLLSKHLDAEWSIPIQSLSADMYADARFVSFAFNQDMLQRIRVLPESEYLAIMDSFEQAMEITVVHNSAESSSDAKGWQKKLQEKEQEIQRLRERLERLEQAQPQSAQDDGMYRRMYESLLDKLMAR